MKVDPSVLPVIAFHVWIGAMSIVCSMMAAGQAKDASRHCRFERLSKRFLPVATAAVYAVVSLLFAGCAIAFLLTAWRLA